MEAKGVGDDLMGRSFSNGVLGCQGKARSVYIFPRV